MSRRILFTVVICAAAMSCASSPSETRAMLPSGDDSSYAGLRQRIADAETLQVIVGVNVEGEATPENIRRAQDTLIASLPAEHVEEVSRFDAIPFIVLRVDAAGLEALIASPLVTSIEEDTASPPNG